MPAPRATRTAPPVDLRNVPPTREAWNGGVRFPRHRHHAGYLTIVLAGSYEEFGDRGRHRVSAGDVLIHDAFESHGNLIGGSGARMLTFALPKTFAPTAGRGILDDPDHVAVIAETDHDAALACVLCQVRPVETEISDWQEDLAESLGGEDGFDLKDWAWARGLHPASLSRGFRQVFGVSPQRFRLERRAQAAWRDCMSSALTFSEIAAVRGFSDQAHMTRAIRGLTGAPPGYWRGLSLCKTAAIGRAHMAG